MIIGILKETKIREGRVALTPKNVSSLVNAGHPVLVQKDAGLISGFSNTDYQRSGAKMVASTRDLICPAHLVLKVKEPIFSELDAMHEGQIIFCYLHLAAAPLLLKKILQKKIIALGFETVQKEDGSLPLLKPMSEIAGKLATQIGAHFLRADQGGRGVLMGGTETVPPANVLILGAGVVGENATKIAVGMGAHTSVLDISQGRLDHLKAHYACETFLSSPDQIKVLLTNTDLLIGAVLVPAARAPILVNRVLVKSMRKGSVIVDVAVDQGGCVETSELTTHAKPIIVKHGVLHYGVPNIPGAVPVTGTLALSQAIFPYVKNLATLGFEACLEKFSEMKRAVNGAYGKIVHQSLAKIL